MRSSKKSKFDKPSIRTKIKKKRNGRSWYVPIGTHVSDKNIENINEALRKNKSASCEGRGSWRLMPKDSCEVYRDRRRRQLNQRRDGSLSDEQLGKLSKTQSKNGRNKGPRCAKKQTATRRYEKKSLDPQSESTMHSNTDSQMTKSSMSVCSCSSCASSSEMES